MLYEELQKLDNENAYPFHMPGHKRQVDWIKDPHAIDITEVPGYDNLHDAHGILASEMARAANIYGAKQSFLLVNGSTCGNLAAVFAATEQHDTVLLGRGCHKSVYHAAWLRECVVEYLYPQVDALGYPSGTTEAEVRRALVSYPEAAALVITSPTYEGVVEDLTTIVALAHANGTAVIVDAAHGAHQGFDPSFGASSLTSGADVVIMSLHKTLPSLTQTALLHISEKSMISAERIAQYLGVFETSSPSYVLMASIGRCLDFMETEKEAFARYAKRLSDFYQNCEDLTQLTLLSPKGRDASKVVIVTKHSPWNGHELSEILRREYGLVLEMDSFSYALAMTSVMDDVQALARLADALHELDARADQMRESCVSEDDCQEDRVPVAQGETVPDGEANVIAVDCKEKAYEKDTEFTSLLTEAYRGGEKRLTLAEALHRERREVTLEEAIGQTAESFVAIYPPGVPLIVPGEEIEAHQIALLRAAEEEGLTITGRTEDGRIAVVAFS